MTFKEKLDDSADQKPKVCNNSSKPNSAHKQESKTKGSRLCASVNLH